MQKFVVYLTTFVILAGLAFGGYKFYFNYQDDLYDSLQEYDSYETLDGKYTVAFRDTNKYGAEESLKLKLYLVNNETEDASYIATVSCVTYDLAFEYSEDKDDDNIIHVTVTDRNEKQMYDIDISTGRKAKDS